MINSSAGVTSALDKQRRPIGMLAALLVGNRDLPDIAPFERLANRVQIHEIWMLRCPGFQQADGLVVGVIVGEVDLPGGLRLQFRVVHAYERRCAVTGAADAVHRFRRRTRRRVGRLRRRLTADRRHRDRCRQHASEVAQRHVCLHA